MRQVVIASVVPVLAVSLWVAMGATGRGQVNPIVICGQTLYDEQPDALVTQFLRPGHYQLNGLTARSPSSDFPRVLQFVASCRAGVSISFTPSRP